MIHERTQMGVVRLGVADLERIAGFYEQVIGLDRAEREASLIRLGTSAGPLVELTEDPEAPPRPPGTTGLFHLAILVPDRSALAAALRRVVDSGWRLSGASDHLVSESLYLRDPEGNGIELYRDRPREDWGHKDGEIEMATLPLDVRSLVGESEPEPAMRAGTAMGHVHLQVADLEEAERFYCGLVGFEVTVRTYPGALFVAAGGYHHHLGLNTWAGDGAPPPPANSRGMRWFEVVVPAQEEVETITGRLEAAGHAVERDGGALRVSDPSHNGVLIRAT
jgi:catechol 2,3-dioxygenase